MSSPSPRRRGWGASVRLGGRSRHRQVNIQGFGRSRNPPPADLRSPSTRPAAGPTTGDGGRALPAVDEILKRILTRSSPSGLRDASVSATQ